MTIFDQNDFNNFVIDNKVIGFFEKPIALKSGRLSSWYVNWRTVAKDVYLTDILADQVIAFTNYLCGEKNLKSFVNKRHWYILLMLGEIIGLYLKYIRS